MTRLNLTKIGGSDVAPILDISPFSSSISVWQRLTLGVRDEINEHARERMEWGNILETPVKTKWVEKFEPERADEWRAGVSREPSDPDWIRYTVDFERAGALLEVKTTSAYARSKWGVEHTDEIPIYYSTQVHWYLYHERRRLRGLDQALPEYCDLAVLVGGQELLSYRVYADDVLGAEIFHRVAEWRRRYVLTKKQPPIDASQGARDYLAGLYNKISGQIRPAENDEAEKLAAWLDLQAQKKELEKQIALAENRIIERIAADDGIEAEMNDGKIRATFRRPKPTERVSWKNARKEIAAQIDPQIFAEIIETHTTRSEPARRLSIRKIK